MPATVTRPRKRTAETGADFPINGSSTSVREDAPDFAAFSRVQTAPPFAYRQDDEADGIEREAREERVEWREVAPLVDQFTNAMPEAERKRRRGLRKRHRNFVMSGVFWVGLLFGVELVCLVFLYSIDLRALRYEKALDNDIQKTSLDIALAQNQLAASSSPAKLDAWAAELGYHKAQLTEMDDVTSSVPAPTSAPAQ